MKGEMELQANLCQRAVSVFVFVKDLSLSQDAEAVIDCRSNFLV